MTWLGCQIITERSFLYVSILSLDDVMMWKFCILSINTYMFRLKIEHVHVHVRVGATFMLPCNPGTKWDWSIGSYSPELSSRRSRLKSRNILIFGQILDDENNDILHVTFLDTYMDVSTCFVLYKTLTAVYQEI